VNEDIQGFGRRDHINGVSRSFPREGLRMEQPLRFRLHGGADERLPQPSYTQQALLGSGIRGTHIRDSAGVTVCRCGDHPTPLWQMATIWPSWAISSWPPLRREPGWASTPSRPSIQLTEAARWSLRLLLTTRQQPSRRTCGGLPCTLVSRFGAARTTELPNGYAWPMNRLSERLLRSNHTRHGPRFPTSGTLTG
jgi:hypothetical protein